MAVGGEGIDLYVDSIKMTFHLMDFKRSLQKLGRNERVILSVIDSQVLVSVAIKRKLPSRFAVAGEILSISCIARN